MGFWWKNEVASGISCLYCDHMGSFGEVIYYFILYKDKLSQVSLSFCNPNLVIIILDKVSPNRNK